MPTTNCDHTGRLEPDVSVTDWAWHVDRAVLRGTATGVNLNRVPATGANFGSAYPIRTRASTRFSAAAPLRP
jgi:hypothetical protein